MLALIQRPDVPLRCLPLGGIGRSTPIWGIDDMQGVVAHCIELITHWPPHMCTTLSKSIDVGNGARAPTRVP